MATATATTGLVQLEEHRRTLYTLGSLRGATGKEIALRPAGLTQDAGLALRAVVEREQPARTIEVGMAVGMSTVFLLEGALASCPGREPRHVAVDPGQSTRWDQAAILQLRAAGCDRFVTVIEEDSVTALPRMIAEQERFDFAFVDGSHWFENVFLDLVCMARLVKPGGAIVVDDLWMPAVQHAVAYAVTNLGLANEPFAQPGVRERMTTLRLPLVAPKRDWNHFVPFAGWKQP